MGGGGGEGGCSFSESSTVQLMNVCPAFDNKVIYLAWSF